MNIKNRIVHTRYCCPAWVLLLYGTLRVHIIHYIHFYCHLYSLLYVLVCIHEQWNHNEHRRHDDKRQLQWIYTLFLLLHFTQNNNYDYFILNVIIIRIIISSWDDNHGSQIVRIHRCGLTVTNCAANRKKNRHGACRAIC